MNSGYGKNIARYKSARIQCCGAFRGGGRLKALCTALLLGGITFGGGYAAQAIDITDQIGLTDVANYITGNQLHIKNPIALDGTAAFPVISSANVEIYGNDNAITGAIYQYSNDGRDPLEYGHYVIGSDSDVLFDGMNFATETTIAASAGVGGEAARPDLQ